MAITRHNIAHYAIGALAIGLGAHAVSHEKTILKAPEAPIYADATQPVSRFTWPSLGQDKVTALGEALKESSLKSVTIFCASPECHGLMLDLDEAMQVAGISSGVETRQVDSESDMGLFVGPPGIAADVLAEAIKDKTGITPAIVDIAKLNGGVGIIIGKKSGEHD